MKEKILVTGSAGFIGYHLCHRLIKENYEVIGLDNLNDYYDVSLKKSRNQILNSLSKKRQNNYNFYKVDIADLKLVENIFKSQKPKIIINLAAQAGVRYSIENPNSYGNSNLMGFLNIRRQLYLASFLAIILMLLYFFYILNCELFLTCLFIVH